MFKSPLLEDEFEVSTKKNRGLHEVGEQDDTDNEKTYSILSSIVLESGQ